MALFRTSTYADATEQTVSATPVFVKSIIAHVQPGGGAGIVYLKLWDATNPDPAAAQATFVLPILSASFGFGVIGRQTESLRKTKVVFPDGGLIFSTALTMLVVTTPGGSTAPTGADVPTVEIHYAPIL